MKLQLLIAALTLSLPTLSVAPIQPIQSTDAGAGGGVDGSTEPGALQAVALIERCQETAFRLSVRDDQVTKCVRVYVATTTSPGQSGFAVFERQVPAEVEGDGGIVKPAKTTSFGLFFYFQAEKLRVVPEDFLPIDSP